MLADLLSQPKADTPIFRSSFLLLRALSISKISILLTRKLSLEDLLVFINSISVIDTDTTCWLLNHIHHSFSCHKQSQVQRINLYTAMIKGARSQQMQLAIISNLADDLMFIFEKHSQIPDEFDFLQQWVVSADIPENSDGVSIWNRDMVNASLRLQGCLLALRMLSFDVPEVFLGFKTSLDKWVQSLRFAMGDETVSWNGISLRLMFANQLFRNYPPAMQLLSQ